VCQLLGFAIEKRPFRPHVTIARMRRGQPAEASIKASAKRGFGPVLFSVTDLTLFESELRPEGSVYTIISRHRLAG
jgi:RNA 2',3'-cyclic 3'-phosphodiesterase